MRIQSDKIKQNKEEWTSYIDRMNGNRFPKEEELRRFMKRWREE